jgi:hypothetical protein
VPQPNLTWRTENLESETFTGEKPCQRPEVEGKRGGGAWVLGAGCLLCAAAGGSDCRTGKTGEAGLVADENGRATRPKMRARAHTLALAFITVSSVVVLCCMYAAQQLQGLPSVLLLSRRQIGLQGDQPDFFELNSQIDERQRAIHHARAQLLWSRYQRSEKGTTQQLYQEADASPSGAMLREYWKDFTALPPSHRPGMGMAASSGDMDARIASLRNFHLGHVEHRGRKIREDEEEAAEEAEQEADDAVLPRRQRRRGVLQTQLAELSLGDEDAAGMAGAGTMAARSVMAGGSTMAAALGALETDGASMSNGDRMASTRGLQAGAASMAGSGLLSGGGSEGAILAKSNTVLADPDALLAGDSLLASPGRGLSYARAPRFTVLASQTRSCVHACLELQCGCVMSNAQMRARILADDLLSNDKLRKGIFSNDEVGSRLGD